MPDSRYHLIVKHKMTAMLVSGRAQVRPAAFHTDTNQKPVIPVFFDRAGALGFMERMELNGEYLIRSVSFQELRSLLEEVLAQGLLARFCIDPGSRDDLGESREMYLPFLLEALQNSTCCGEFKRVLESTEIPLKDLF
jgi:hypothetical protein